MKRFVVVTAAVVLVGVALGLLFKQRQAARQTVAFSEVNTLLTNKCSGCHPGVVPSLDLTAKNAYASTVGIRSVEAPTLARVIAGDPDHSFLYLKIAGWPGNHGNPVVGARMPFGSGALKPDEIKLVRDWIREGARDEKGQTHSAGEVATPGTVTELAAAKAPQIVSGDAVIEGTITDAADKPLPGAYVSMLVIRKDLPGGEEHYRFGATDKNGRYRITGAPIGSIAVKAYAPGTVYVTHYLTTQSGKTTTVDVGLPKQVNGNPKIADAKIERVGNKLRLSMTVTGSALDRNYTLAVNAKSGDSFEIKAN